MTLQEVIDAIESVRNAKTVEERSQKLDYLLDGVPLDRSKIDEIEDDIEDLKLEAHNLDSRISVEIIEEIIAKYKLK